MGLVANDQVIAAIRCRELLLNVFITREFVEPGDGQIVFKKPVAGAGGFELVIGHDLERQVETPGQFVLPLLHETAGTDDQAAAQIATRNQFLDEQARHDGLARARIVGQQEAQGLARQHGFVDRRDLMRQRVDEGRMDGQHRIEQVGQADAVGLGHQSVQGPVAVETPRPASRHDLQARLVVPVEDFIGDAPIRATIDQRQGVRSMPGDIDHGDRGIGQNATQGSLRLKVFEVQGWCVLIGRQGPLLVFSRTVLSRPSEFMYQNSPE